MKLAISNIAWAPSDDAAVAAEMRAAGADGVEVAPTTVWPDPLAASPGERAALRARWRAEGFPIVALQSLLFGRPDLQLFDAARRGELRDRLLGMLDLAADLGAGPLVLGSPRNRLRGELPWDVALEIAAPFFRELGDAAAARGVCLCIEPNPPRYGCDFVTTAAEGAALVRAAGSPGFRLHLDAAGMLLAGDDPAATVRASLPWLAHVHLSAPDLGFVGPGAGLDHAAIAAALAQGGYRGFVSIEMRAVGDAAERVRRAGEALRYVAALLEVSSRP